MKEQRPSLARFFELRGLLERRPWSVLSWSSGIIALAFIAWYGIQIPLGNPTIGEQFVLSEWPSSNIFPYFYAKPITWFSYFSFLYWAFGLESHRNMFIKMSPQIRRLIFIITATVAFGALYEIFFNFTIWGALMAVTQCPPLPQPCNPDVLANAFPALRINLVFATKVVTTVFALSVYSLWYVHRIEKHLESSYSSQEPR